MCHCMCLCEKKFTVFVTILDILLKIIKWKSDDVSGVNVCSISLVTKEYAYLSFMASAASE